MNSVGATQNCTGKLINWGDGRPQSCTGKLINGANWPGNPGSGQAFFDCLANEKHRGYWVSGKLAKQPTFFLIQWKKKDKGYKKKKRINPPAICFVLPGLPGQSARNPRQYLIIDAHVAYITPGQPLDKTETSTKPIN